MNITHILLNNNELGKITQEQRSSEYEVWQTSLLNPDFAAYARDCGAFGRQVDDPSQLSTVIADALAHPGPALVEIVTDPGRPSRPAQLMVMPPSTAMVCPVT